ncbi:hypothetical protein, partial [Acetobacter cerevisiae]
RRIAFRLACNSGHAASLCWRPHPAFESRAKPLENLSQRISKRALMTVLSTRSYYDFFPLWAENLITNQNKTIASVSLIVTTFALAFVINCVVSSPYRVWAEFHALMVRVPRNSSAPPENVGSGKLKTSVRLWLKNRSSKSIVCKIRALEIKALGTIDRGYNQFPWLINTVKIHPKDENLVEIALCFFGGNAHYICIFNERSGAFAENSVMDFHSSIIGVLIEVSTDTEIKKIWCKITRDTQNKTLTMEAITQVPTFSASGV